MDMNWSKAMRIGRFVPLGLLALTACTSVDTSFGEAMRWDVAQQTINPEPPAPQAGAPIEGGAGRKAEGAVDRYQKGTVKEPAILRTGSTSGGSSSSR